MNRSEGLVLFNTILNLRKQDCGIQHDGVDKKTCLKRRTLELFVHKFPVPH
jgi:hypothetical protein